MRIAKIAGYVGAGLLSASCNFKPATEKALEHASKYLTGSELVVAEGKAWNIAAKDNMNYSPNIFYWDSLLSVNKGKEFFENGKKYIKDSVAGNFKRRVPVHLYMEPDLTQDGKTIVDSIKKEVAKYHTGEEMLSLERKAPKEYSEKWGTRDNQVTHYYGTLAVRGAERKGFNDGMISERKKLGIKK